LTEDQVNILSYTFVQKVRTITDENEEKSKGGSLDHLPFTDWSDKVVEGPTIKRTLNHNLSNFKITLSIKGIDYGFDEPVYLDFFRLVSEIQSLDSFAQSVSFEFIEENTLKWIVDVYLSGKSNVELVNYLRDHSETVIEKKKFYFHVLNLHIHEPFKIGNVEITFFTKEYFDNFWNSYQRKEETTQEVFDDVFRKYQGRVFASYEIKAESKKGEELAFDECSLAIDALRCFTTTTIFPDRKCYMDLSDRININYQTDIISIPTGKEFEFQISLSAKNDPFTITKEFYEHILKTGLRVFSDKIKSKERDELSLLIIQSIKLFSYSISTFDLHSRVIQLVTIFESLLLEEDRKHKMEEFVKRRLKKLFGKMNTDSLELILVDMYQIRHKMVHKAKRLQIEMTKLRDFQITAIETIKILCSLNATIKDKEGLIKHLDHD
jgi:hypothetical protein